MTPGQRLIVLRILALLIVVGLSLYIYSIRNQAEQLAIYGYPGIFVITFLAYATVLLPAPGAAVVFTMGAVFHPLGVGIAAGAGAALGELVGYLAGFSGQAVAEKTKVFETLHRWMQKRGGATILLLSMLPNPFFDVAGVVAGILKMPVLKFLFYCWVGETVKMIVLAYSGAGSLNRWFE